jgi:hypothetical protein
MPSIKVRKGEGWNAVFNLAPVGLFPAKPAKKNEGRGSQDPDNPAISSD